MQAIRKIVHLLLILTMLTVAFPLVRPEDANRDNRLELEDTILHIRALVRSAETTGFFAASLGNAVASLKILAGLKTVIKTAGQTNHTGNPPPLDFPYLISTFRFYLPSQGGLAVKEGSLIYNSLSIAPSPPPPRSAFSC